MIRMAVERDAEQIAAIYRPYVEKTAITFEEAPPSAENIAARIARVGGAFPFIVFEEPAAAGEILGYAYATRFRERAAYRWSLEDSVYVREDCRGRGIGGSLLTVLIDLLRDLGYVKIYAVITPPNPASVKLHEKLGFTPLARFADTAFKLGAWQSIDWLELTLRQPTRFPRSLLRSQEFALAEPARLSALLGRT